MAMGAFKDPGRDDDENLITVKRTAMGSRISDASPVIQHQSRTALKIISEGTDISV